VGSCDLPGVASGLCNSPGVTSSSCDSPGVASWFVRFTRCR